MEMTSVLYVMPVWKPKENISIAVFKYASRNIILTAIYSTERLDPGSRQSGTAANAALPAVTGNGRSWRREKRLFDWRVVK
jgi:hypothetical protein